MYRECAIEQYARVEAMLILDERDMAEDGAERSRTTRRGGEGGRGNLPPFRD
jgi:hypothetical protein